VSETASQKIDIEKCLISLLWSVNGIHSLVDVPTGSTYNSAFFCDTVVSNLFDELLYIPEENHPMVCASTWTMHVRMMQGDPLNVFTQNHSRDMEPGLQPGLRTKWLLPL
jgi:hypothetical protein